MEEQNKVNEIHHLTVRFLVSSSGTWTAEFLGLRSSGIGDHESSVVLDEAVLQDSLGVLVDVLLVVSNDGSADGLSYGVDLSHSSTTADLDFDVNGAESVLADHEEGLLKLES